MIKNKGKIITITSAKGGVGKTITTLNLAGIYHLLGKKVLILDLDLYSGGIATYVNSNNDKTIYNLMDDLSYNRFKNIEDYIFKYNENISIIAAPKDPRLASKIESKFIPLILNNVLYAYDIILIDTSHILNETNIVTIDNSDSVLFMFTNDPLDIKNTKNFTSIIKDVGYTNVYMMLNNSRDPEKNYYSLYDIKNIIKTNIDYTIPKTMHIKNIDKLLINNEIITLSKNLIIKEQIKKLKDIASNIYEGSKK